MGLNRVQRQLVSEGCAVSVEDAGRDPLPVRVVPHPGHQEPAVPGHGHRGVRLVAAAAVVHLKLGELAVGAAVPGRFIEVIALVPLRRTEVSDADLARIALPADATAAVRAAVLPRAVRRTADARRADLDVGLAAAVTAGSGARLARARERPGADLVGSAVPAVSPAAVAAAGLASAVRLADAGAVDTRIQRSGADAAGAAAAVVAALQSCAVRGRGAAAPLEADKALAAGHPVLKHGPIVLRGRRDALLAGVVRVQVPFWHADLAEEETEVREDRGDAGIVSARVLGTPEAVVARAAGAAAAIGAALLACAEGLADARAVHACVLSGARAAVAAAAVGAALLARAEGLALTDPAHARVLWAGARAAVAAAAVVAALPARAVGRAAVVVVADLPGVAAPATAGSAPRGALAEPAHGAGLVGAAVAAAAAAAVVPAVFSPAVGLADTRAADARVLPRAVAAVIAAAVGAAVEARAGRLADAEAADARVLGPGAVAAVTAAAVVPAVLPAARGVAAGPCVADLAGLAAAVVAGDAVPGAGAEAVSAAELVGAAGPADPAAAIVAADLAFAIRGAGAVVRVRVVCVVRVVRVCRIDRVDKIEHVANVWSVVRVRRCTVVREIRVRVHSVGEDLPDDHVGGVRGCQVRSVRVWFGCDLEVDGGVEAAPRGEQEDHRRQEDPSVVPCTHHRLRM